MRRALKVALVVFVVPALRGLSAADVPLPHLEARAWASDPGRILLIGNSHIFMNDLPAMLSRLAESADIACSCGQAAYSSYELAQHAVDSRTLSCIAEKPWDIVVLQERTTVLLTRVADFTKPAVLALSEAAAVVGG